MRDTVRYTVEPPVLGGVTCGGGPEARGSRASRLIVANRSRLQKGTPLGWEELCPGPGCRLLPPLVLSFF